MYEDCEFYLEYIELRKKDFLLSASSVKKRQQYHQIFCVLKFFIYLIFVTKILKHSCWCNVFMNTLILGKKKSLPSKEKLFSRLSNKEISDRGYRHVQRVRIKFNIKRYIRICNKRV